MTKLNKNKTDIDPKIIKAFNSYIGEVSSLVTIVEESLSYHAKQLTAINEGIQSSARSLVQLAEQASKLPFEDILQGLRKAGLTPNLDESKDISNLKKFQKVLDQGYAFFWIPRAEIADKLILANKEKERKKIVSEFQSEILEDCSKVLTLIKSQQLRNHALHLSDAISSFNNGNFRSSQSATTICIDSLLDLLIRTSSLSKFGELLPKTKDDASKLKKIQNIPVPYLYAALQARLVSFVFRKFDRLNSNTVSTKYARHSSTHSVSKRQYSEFNALQGIMIATSLLKTTEKLGTGWLTELADMA